MGDTMDKFVPDIYQKSIFTINYSKLKTSGIKCLLFDLDNTIAPLTIDAPDKKTKGLFEDLKDMGFKVILFSNNSRKRVGPFKNSLNVDSCANARKPFKKKYNKILEIYKLKDTEVAGIGDQILTDVFGANRMGFTSILVNPISKSDIFVTRINRYFEKRIMNRLEKKGLFEIGVYYE